MGSLSGFVLEGLTASGSAAGLALQRVSGRGELLTTPKVGLSQPYPSFYQKFDLDGGLSPVLDLVEVSP